MVQVLWQNTQHTAILDAEDGRFVAFRVDIQRVAIISLPRQIFCAQHPCHDSVLSDFQKYDNHRIDKSMTYDPTNQSCTELKPRLQR